MTDETKIVVKIVADDKDAKTKAQKTGKNITEAINKSGKKINVGEKIKQSLEDAKKGVEALGASGEKLSKLGAFFTAGKLGLIAGAVVGLGKLAIGAIADLFASTEEKIKKSELKLNELNQISQTENQNQNKDNSYLQRLKELSEVQNLDNLQKKQAIFLIQELNKRYNNLGLSIDVVSGKIVGLYEAQEKINKQQATINLKNLQNKLTEIQKITEKKLTFALIDVDSIGAAKYVLKEILDIFGVKPQGVTNAEDFLKSLNLEQQIKALQYFRQHSNNKQTIDSITQVINLKMKELEIQNQINNLIELGKKSREQYAEFLKNQQKFSAEAKIQNYQKLENKYSDEYLKNYQDDFYNSLDDSEKINYLIDEKQRLIDKIAELHKKNDVLVNSPKLDDEIELNKNYAQISRLQLEIQKTESKIEAIKNKSKKYYDDNKNNLQNELQYQKLILQGKFAEVEKLKIINELKKQGLIIDEKEIQTILAKKEALSKIKANEDINNIGQSVLDKYSVKSLDDITSQRISNIEKANNISLSDDLKSKIKNLTKIEFDLGELDKLKPNLSMLEIKTNDLTARGGFSSGAVIMADKDRINQQIANYSMKQANLLQQIKNIIQNGGLI